MTATKPVQLRLTPDVHGQLHEIADREHNAVSAVIRRLLSSALKAEAAK